MKTALIIFCVLAAATVIYGSNRNKLTYKETYVNCAKDLGQPVDKPRVDVTLCAVQREGLLHPNGEYNTEKAVCSLYKHITDLKRREKAFEIYDRCHKLAIERGAVGLNRTLMVTPCAMRMVYLLD